MKIIFYCISFALLCSCANQKKETDSPELVKAIVPSERIDLWNGVDFSGWELFIPDSTMDVNQVWQVRDGVIHCSGVPNGYMRTRDDYADYKLTLEWRWPEEPGNSGVLLHISLPDVVWPKCIEAQLMSGNAGDFFLIGGTSLNEQIDKTSRRIQKKQDSSENTPGEWNKYEITCTGDLIRLYVNGVLQNEGSGASVQQGKIGFQSEGKPIQFRNIRLEAVLSGS
jgi:hypothetical protein